MKLLLIGNTGEYAAPLLRTIAALQHSVITAYSLFEAGKMLQNPCSIDIVLLSAEFLREEPLHEIGEYLETTAANIAVCAHSEACSEHTLAQNGYARLIHASIPADISPLHLQNIIALAQRQRRLVTENRQLTRQLEHERRESRSSRIILDELDTAVLLLRPDHSIIRMNSSGYALLGSAAASHGKTPYTCLHRNAPWPGYLRPDAPAAPRRQQLQLYIPELRQLYRITRVPLGAHAEAAPGSIIEYWDPASTPLHSGGAPQAQPQSQPQASPHPHPQQQPSARPPATAGLTKREWEVLSLLLRGDTYQQIGAELAISPHTVKNHAAGIYQKTGTNSRMALARLLHTLCP